MAICLFATQTMSVFASPQVSVTEEQIKTIFDGMDSVVAQLKELGLSENDMKELFKLSPREDGFYQQTSTKTIPYTGEFAASAALNQSEKTTYRSFDGNPPDSDAEQKKRIENIYGIALQYYKSDYYEGSSETASDFGDYLTYLYLSHYIDEPGSAPTERELPYIISSSDVNAYRTFLKSGKLSNWATALADLGSSFYADFDYIRSLNAINTADITLRQGLENITQIAWNGYSTKSALSTLSPMIKDYIIDHHTTAVSDIELTQDTSDYVSSQLNALNFYENYDENITNSLKSILISTFISIICNSVSVLGLFVTVIPFYVYGFTTLLETAALVTLQYSFSGRYAIRTAIYLGI